MDQEQIEKAMHDGIAKALESQLAGAVQMAVDQAVNGKVKALSKQINDLTNEEGTGKLDPIVMAYGNWLTWRRTAAMGLGFMLAIGGLISTVQTIWGLLSQHLVVK